MVKSIIFIAVLCFLSNIVSSQHILFDWQSCIKGGKYNTERSVLCQAENGYFIAATHERGSHVDIVLLKTSLNGDSLWRKYYGGSDDDWSCGVFPTLDGNYYIVGTECSEDGDITNNPYPNSCNIWIIKIDSSGNKIWDKIYGGNNFDEAENAIVTYDGGLAILSLTYSGDGDITTNFAGIDIWVLKIDSNGEKEWDYTMGSYNNDFPSSIQQSKDSSFFVSGYFRSSTGGNIDCSYTDLLHVDGLLFQLNKNGILLNQKCYHGSEDDAIRSILELPDGYMITGGTFSADIASSNIGFHQGYTPNGDPTSDIWLQKTDFNWNIEWQRCYGGSGWDDIKRIYLCTNGDYMMFGTTTSNDGDVSGFHGAWEMGDIWMVRLNSLGEIIWQRCIGKLAAERLQMNSILKLDDAHYILSVEAEGCIMDDDFTCTTTDDPYNCYNYTWLIQINDTAASVGITEPLPTINIKLYPNPATDYIALEIPPEFDMINTQADILDVSGKTLKSVVVTGHKPYLYTGDLPAGLYLLRLINKQGFVSKRFVKNVN